ncbi:MAG: DUF6526 family protein [Algoriphagus sp.]|nr:DUF6526 family protein [Algoriphagus sp.]
MKINGKRTLPVTFSFTILYLHHLLPSLFVWTIAKMDFSSQKVAFDSRILLSGALMLVLLPLVARVYARTPQNQISFNEMRSCYFHLTRKTFELKEKNLKQGQLIGLRFASDENLLSLIDPTIEEKLTAKDSKQQLTNWRDDYLREYLVEDFN